MVIETIRNLIADKEPTPNKFSITMGGLIRKAREEANISQSELARLIYRRQATLSDMENGKVEVSSGTLALLAAALEKPITYFYPPFLYRELIPEEFTPLEQELFTLFSNVYSNHLQKVVIDIVRVLSEFNPEEMFLDSVERFSTRIENEEYIKQLLETHGSVIFRQFFEICPKIHSLGIRNWDKNSFFIFISHKFVNGLR